MLRQNAHTTHGPRNDRYAIWVGNIPHQTTVMGLRDYFSKAMPTPYDLLSISYNPDARYAFVNLRNESARMMALQRAASALFNGKRLDCRIRRDGSTRSAKVNYGLDPSGAHQQISLCAQGPDNLWHKVEELSRFPETHPSQYGKEKYFIVKSYSLEALHQSLWTGPVACPQSAMSSG